MMRHGESIWNKNNLFTGWVDVGLSDKGIEEALKAGEKIKDLPVDIVFVSALIRAQMTAFIAMMHHNSKKVLVLLHPGKGKMEKWATIYGEEARQNIIPVYAAWQLNERMYGALQGLNKAETMEKFGKEQVQIWRRSFDVAPPKGESLKLTAKRSIPYFKKKIMPLLQDGKNVLISAHGNSLRSILMEIDNLSKEEVVKLELATGEPVIYNYEDGKLRRE